MKGNCADRTSSESMKWIFSSSWTFPLQDIPRLHVHYVSLCHLNGHGWNRFAGHPNRPQERATITSVASGTLQALGHPPWSPASKWEPWKENEDRHRSTHGRTWGIPVIFYSLLWTIRIIIIINRGIS
jgi:hypothetical protein